MSGEPLRAKGGGGGEGLAHLETRARGSSRRPPWGAQGVGCELELASHDIGGIGVVLAHQWGINTPFRRARSCLETWCIAYGGGGGVCKRQLLERRVGAVHAAHGTATLLRSCDRLGQSG